MMTSWFFYFSKTLSDIIVGISKSGRSAVAVMAGTAVQSLE
ncbi:hypothetical protein [Bartonella henselae]|nr:hypothetical protein [Bartonella henselae]MDM9996689.1 hypothetical protein [Bartonella henselae]